MAQFGHKVTLRYDSLESDEIFLIKDSFVIAKRGHKGQRLNNIGFNDMLMVSIKI